MMIFYETHSGVSVLNSNYVVEVFHKACSVQASVVDTNNTAASLLYPHGHVGTAFRYVELCHYDTEEEALEAMQDFYAALRNGDRVFWFGYTVEHGGKKPNEVVIPF